MPVDYTSELASDDYSSELAQQDFSDELTKPSRAIGFGKPKTRPGAQAIERLFQTTPFQPTVTLPMRPEEAGDVVLGSMTGSPQGRAAAFPFAGPLMAAGAKTGREIAEGLTSPVNLALSLLNPAMAGLRAGLRAPGPTIPSPKVIQPPPAEIAPPSVSQVPQPAIPWPSTVTPPQPSVLDLARRFQQGVTEATLRKSAQAEAEKAGLPIPRQMPEAENVKLETFQTPTNTPPAPRPGDTGLKAYGSKSIWVASGRVPTPVTAGPGVVSPALPRNPGPNTPPPGPPISTSPVAGGGPNPIFASNWQRDWQRLQGYFRWDRAMLDVVPNTPVLTNIEALRAGPQAELQVMIASPTYQNLRAMEKQVERLEYDAVVGGKPLDPHLQAVNDSVNASTTAVNEVYKRRGLPTVSLIEGPYVPRRTSEQWADENLVRQGFAGGQGARTGIGPYERERVFPTIREGRQGGVEYRTATESALWHEAYNRLVIATDRVMTNLEQAGVLNRAKADALTKAVRPGQVLNVKGLPFEPPGGWWVRSVEEGRFLQQNLRPSPGGTFTQFFNQVVRNPGLVIPNKHILNMLDKFGVSGGNWATMLPYFAEIEHSPTPKYKTEFSKYVPMTEGTSGTWRDMFRGGNISQQIAQATPIDWTKPSSVGTKMLESISKTNDPSAYVIFNHVDRSLRYARWRQYLNEFEQTGAIRGFRPANLDEAMQVAGNHVMLDLVRYGARSARLDYLKAFPLNFYAAWRTGSLSTILKAAKYSPIPALMYVGAMDMARLIDYRQNTYTHHRFWDYVERPLAALAEAAQTIYKGKPGAWQEASTELTKALAGQAAFGPGGDITARNLEAVFRDLQGKVAPEEAMRMFLVLNTVYSVVPEMQQYKKTGDLKYLANAFLSVLINRRPALMQKPRMLLDYIIPEVGPFERSGQTKTVEALQEAIKGIRYGRGDVSQYVKEATEKGMSPADLAIFRLTKQLSAAGGRPVRQ